MRLVAQFDGNSWGEVVAKAIPVCDVMTREGYSFSAIRLSKTEHKDRAWHNTTIYTARVYQTESIKEMAEWRNK